MTATRRRQRARSRPFPLGRRPLALGLVIAALVGVNLYVFLWRGGTSIPDVMEQASVAGPGQGPAGPAATPPGTEPAAPPAAAANAPAETGRWVDGQVQAGDSLGQILRREGLTPPEADQLLRALRQVMDFRAIREGQKYRLHFDASGALIEFELIESKVVTVRARRGADGGLTAEKIKAATEARVSEVSGVIESSLYASIKASQEDTALVGFFVDVFAYDLNFYIDTHPGDTFRMLIEKVYLDGKFLRYGRVLAAEYAGKVGTFRAFWWQPPGAKNGRYFDEQGRSIEKTFLKTPLKYRRVSSGFNPRRMHPILHVVKGHFGTDYAAPVGTPVWAAAGGRISFRGPRGGAGNCIILKHDNGLQTIYMHLSRFKQGLKVGQRVAQKDVIGFVGTTGLSTGPHLHFAVKKNGHYVDALKLKMERGPGVPRGQLEQFKRDTGELTARLAQISVNRLAAGAPAAAVLPN